MLAGLTRLQRIVIIAVVPALIACVWYGSRPPQNDDAPDAHEGIRYTLPDSSEIPITVHVVGAVRSPGLYTLPAGSRVSQAIECAGGFSERARTDSVNLAAFLEDGQQVRVDAEPEPEPASVATPAAAAPVATGSHPQPSTRTAVRSTTTRTPVQTSVPSRGASTRSDLPDFLQSPRTARVRLNSAGLEELQRIDGIGPELAKRIVYDRSVNGPYRSFNDLDRVPGIGQATIEKIRVSATLN